MTERQACLLFAAIYTVELLCALILLSDYSIVPIIVMTSIFSYWVNGKLANPANVLDLGQIAEASASSMIIVVVGLIIVALNVRQWLIALAVVMSYCIGNRLKSANVFRMSSAP